MLPLPGYTDCLGLLVDRHHLTSTDYRILIRMFSLRPPDSDRIQETLVHLERTLGVHHDAIVKAVRRGVDLGVMEKIPTKSERRLVKGVLRWVNGTNIYVFKMPDEIPEPEAVLAVVRLPIVSQVDLLPTNLKVKEKAEDARVAKDVWPEEVSSKRLTMDVDLLALAQARFRANQIAEHTRRRLL
jgi:hypothetical protein